MIRLEGAAQENVINRKSNHIRNDSSTALSGRVFDMDANLGLKPQAAVATLWRAPTISPAEPKNLAATKALRSRAESFHPFGIIPCETEVP
jgi:hypothetical protein